MLEVIGAGNPDYQGKDWGDVYANSPNSEQISEEIARIIDLRRNKQDEKTKDDREFAMPSCVQIVAVTKRAFVAYWRSPDYITVCFDIALISICVLTDDLSNRANLCFIYLLASSTRSHSGTWAIV